LTWSSWDPEVLGEPRSAQHVRELHSQILNDAALQKVFGWQHPMAGLVF
jgi:hypothetical protein